MSPDAGVFASSIRFIFLQFSFRFYAFLDPVDEFCTLSRSIGIYQLIRFDLSTYGYIWYILALSSVKPGEANMIPSLGKSDIGTLDLTPPIETPLFANLRTIMHGPNVFFYPPRNHIEEKFDLITI